MQAQTASKTAAYPLKTRFGEINCDESKAISFPNGILGMPNQKRFIISAMPEVKMDKFQILQSLDDNDVSFAVLPLASLGELIEDSDLEEIRHVLETEKKDFLPMLIVSIQKTPAGAKLSVNLRAPLFLNTSDRTGYQIVLANSKYPVQHVLS